MKRILGFRFLAILTGLGAVVKMGSWVSNILIVSTSKNISIEVILAARKQIFPDLLWGLSLMTLAITFGMMKAS